MSRRSLWFSLAAVALFTLNTGLTRPILPLFARDLGVAFILIGVFDSLGIAANALVRPFSGHLSDLRGRKSVIVFGLILVLVSDLIYLVASSPLASYFLALAALITGIGAASFWPSLKASMAELYQDERERAFGYITATEAIFTAVGSAIGGILAVLTYRAVFGMAALGLMIAILLMLTLKSTPTCGKNSSALPKNQSRGVNWAIFKTVVEVPKNVLVLLIIIIFFNLAIGNFLPFLALYVRDVYGQGTVAIGGVFTALFLSRALAGVVIAWFSQKALQRVRRPLLLSVEIGIGALSFFLLPELGFYPFLGVHLALAFILAAVGISIMALATDLTTQGLGTTIGLIESAGMVAGLVGPIVGGLVYEHNPLWLFPSSGALMLAGLLTLVINIQTLKAPAVQPYER
jgi:DHA1 family multidrug resistance protein-like MFS transporter